MVHLKRVTQAGDSFGIVRTRVFHYSFLFFLMFGYCRCRQRPRNDIIQEVINKLLSFKTGVTTALKGHNASTHFT